MQCLVTVNRDFSGRILNRMINAEPKILSIIWLILFGSPLRFDCHYCRQNNQPPFRPLWGGGSFACHTLKYVFINHQTTCLPFNTIIICIFFPRHEPYQSLCQEIFKIYSYPFLKRVKRIFPYFLTGWHYYIPSFVKDLL